MKNLFAIAVWIVNEARKKGCDPMDIGSAVARALELCSTDAESLFMEIWLAQRFSLDEPERMKRIQKTLSQQPKYRDVLTDIVASCP